MSEPMSEKRESPAILTQPMYTILLVDDNTNNLFTLRELLEHNLEVEVLEAENGSEALDLISRQPQIDLIMLDVQMPGMNGFEVAHLLRSRKKYSSIPIIFLTAVYTADDFKQEGLKQGAIDHLTKPIDDAVLLNRIKAHLRLIENERTFNRELQQLNDHLQQEIEERMRVEQQLREAKELALHLKDEALEAQQEALEAQKEAEKARCSAETANLAKSAFLRNMSHELRTPLNGILGYVQILKQDSLLTDHHRESLDVIQHSGELLLTLLNDILDLSNIDTGRLQLEPGAFHLPELLDKLVDMARGKAQSKGLAMRYDRPDSLPEIVYGDERRLRQVLLHMLGNAVKFTEQGDVTLKVTKVPPVAKVPPIEEDALKSTICNLKFQIQDTGIGIAPDQMEHNFLPFEKLRDTSCYTEGAGLGLALSQRLLLIMGSELHVESQPGEGSMFWFDIDFPVMPFGENYIGEREETFLFNESDSPAMPMMLPPVEALKTLFEAANIGDIHAIFDHLHELEQQTPSCQPFVDRVRPLARSFQLKQLTQILGTYLHQKL